MTTVHRRSRKQEEAGARRFGGRRTPGSGNGWHTKNDVITEDLSIEYKFTDKKSYSLKGKDLVTAEKNALIAGRDMAFIVEIEGREWVVTSRDYFEDHRGDQQ